jgi:Predicted Rossmann fold nucleotide-binding protein
MQYKIAVSGAAEISHCCDNIILLSREVGKEIARSHCVLVSGATTGVPYFSAQGCKQAGGFNVGFSPASSEIEHLRRYRLPLDVFDVMIYTGADYSGRDIIMTKSADAIIIACGRMGTLHEFTTAVECRTIIGVLEGSGGTADKIRELVRGTYRGIKKIVYDRDPAALVRKVAERVDAEKKK